MVKSMHDSSWKIGQVQVYQIVELEDTKFFSTFIPEAIPENVLEIGWLKPDFVGATGNLKALVQSFLIQSNGKNILIDTCNGNSKKRPSIPTWSNLKTDFLKHLKSVNITPHDIDFVVCTHMHFDHVGWNTYRKGGSWEPTFPNATYLFVRGEYDYWVKNPQKEVLDDRQGFADSVEPIIAAGRASLVSDSHKIDDRIRLIPTPGHTPHHVSISIVSQGMRAIISGDALHHPCQIAHPEWMAEADTNSKEALATRIKLLISIADTDTLLIGSHFYYPTAGRILRKGKTFMFKGG